MPISHKHKCIFVHIPKCAGSSIESVLGMHGDIEHIGLKPYLNQELNHDTLFGKGAQHYPLTKLREVLSEDIFQDYFKFSFVRNPWDRFISHVAWSKGIWNGQHTVTHNDVELALSKLKTTSEAELSNHLQPQWKFLCDVNGNIACDYIGRFESLNKDWAYLTKELNLNQPLPKRMVSYHKHYSTYLNDHQVDFLANYYKQDIELFKYKFERLSD